MFVTISRHLKNFSKEQRFDFYQSKYNYYKNMTLVAYHKISNYKIMVILSYLMIHIIIWCTDWATYLLPDRQYASEGMLIMNLLFACACFCAPFLYSNIAHGLFLIDMLVANCIIHYENFGMMLLFNIPCVVAIFFMSRVLEKVYLDHYLVSQQSENLVVHDQLTGVYNRNKLKKISTIEGESLIFPKDLPIGMLIIDIDFFKKVNDNYGHEAGDIVLKHTASILKNSVRSSDYVIRWEGEEFVVIAAGCPIEHSMKLAEKIRKEVECGDNSICPVTVSIGVTTYHGGNYHDALALADQALYQAKSGGRNKVVQYQEVE